MLVIPNLSGRTIDQAAADLRAAGFQFDHLEPSDFVCEYRDDSLMVKQGTVCGQDPMVGAERLPRLIAVRVTIEHDAYEHGAVGNASEWRRMPDVAGKPLDVARSLLARAYLPVGDHFDVLELDADGCATGDVCRTEPVAKGRKVVARKGRIYVGKARPLEVKTTQPAQPTQPTQPTQPSTGDTFF